MSHRNSTIQLIFSPITVEVFRNFLQDLALLRENLIEKRAAKISSGSNVLIASGEDEFYSRSEMKPRPSLLQMLMPPKKINHTSDVEEELLRETGDSRHNISDSYDGYKPEKSEADCIIKSMRIVALVSLVSAVVWVLMMLLRVKKSWIALVVFGMSFAVLLILMILQSMRPAKKSDEEEEPDRLATIGDDPKMRELVYRFNKARMQERKSKARLSSDGNCLSVEIEVNFDQMSKDVQGFHRQNTDQLSEQGDASKPIFFTNEFRD